MPDDEDFYGLVLPFVVVTSKDGPHDDCDFTAGYECGYLDRLLETRDTFLIDRYVHTSIVAQLDLICMRHGYSMKSEPWSEHPDIWSKVVMKRNDKI